MKQVYVEYTVKHVQHLSISDAEFEDFDYDKLECSLDDQGGDIDEVIKVNVDGRPHDF